jgi:hypothetical protein
MRSRKLLYKNRRCDGRELCSGLLMSFSKKIPGRESNIESRAWHRFRNDQCKSSTHFRTTLISLCL